MTPLQIHQPKVVETPDRGPLLSPAAVFDRYFAQGFPKVANRARWIRDTLPDAIRVQLSKRTCGYYAKDVEAYLESIRGK